MDVKQFDLSSGEPLPADDRVFRIVIKDWREKSDKLTPLPKCFSLSSEDKKHGYGLSVDWERKTTPEESIARVGCSYKKDSQEYKGYENRELYAIEVGFLKSLESVRDVLYDPIIHEKPEKGNPENPAHSQAFFNPEVLEKDEAEIYIKIRNHAKDKRILVSMESVNDLVDKYRAS
jgi:hypothetical protein